MDAVAASVVSGFGGAVLGALVGGGASWLTMRHQAALDAHQRQMDRLDGIVVDAWQAADRVMRDPIGESVTQLQNLLLLVMGRANVPSPALARNLATLVPLIGRGRNTDEVRTGALRITLELSAWLGDPARYERAGGTTTENEPSTG
ncbi:hypothetical protein GCM10025782_29430 [Pedococcus ginsenosidimutans]|uniref:Protein kinase n=1 Tax=Pedococcus ginsenosidimutans TaxID=490570 RepID=A0ABP8YGW5_9MICO